MKILKKSISIKLMSFMTVIFVAGTANACDKAAAKKSLDKMTDPRIARIAEEDGWVVVRFGPDYASWTPETRETIIAAFANVDACISGTARSMEFRSPAGKVIARADRVRGIKIY